MSNEIYAFQLDEGYVPKERLFVRLSIKLIEELKDIAEFESKKANEKISPNKLVLRMIQNFIKNDIEIKYVFELDERHVEKKRLCVYLPKELNEKLKERIKLENKKFNKEISKNKFVLNIIQDFIKKEYE
ncbi:DUF2274 domain-containing protein [Clostridium faecium]|nr:DUF2274 domain-containing protein [Clostridium faecium]